MDIRKWHERYSTDCRSKYNSLSTHSSYESGVKLFLTKFENYVIDKSGKFIVFIGDNSWAFSELEFEGYFMNIKESRDEKLTQLLR